MAANITKNQVLALYKSMLRESQKFPNYNFRAYALRRIKDAFKASKTLTDPKIIKKEFEFAQQNFALIKRQVVIGDMFRTDKLVIENLR
ncbi:LYR motif-containing protein 4 homolog [Epargyreus clarus]|uniref:LYR motif-containing protein 4 homolog n=1 Tax=Epargyreus clarus TaxID=520877 RepID=UPI003C2FBE1B